MVDLYYQAMLRPQNAFRTQGNAVLLVTTDETSAEAIQHFLRLNGFHTSRAAGLQAALSFAHRRSMNLLLVDRRQNIIAHLRRDQVIRQIPIIAFQPPGQLCSEQEAIEELAAGFDMVLCDHRYREWLAIFKAVLRRQELSAGPMREFRANQLYMNLDRHEVLVEGRQIQLTAKEFQILQLFLEQCGRVVTRQALLDRVWGEEFAIEEHALDVHIHALRQKLQVTPSFPRMIVTVRGIGYKLSSA